MDLVSVIVLASMILYQGYTNYVEKQKATKRENDLLNRLMSNNFNEYTEGVKYLEIEPDHNNPKLQQLEEEIKIAELREAQDIYPVT